MSEKYFRCECFIHGLVVSYDEECKEIFIERIGRCDEFSFWRRLKMALKLLFKHECLYEEVILNYDNAKEFGNEIIKQIEMNETSKPKRPKVKTLNEKGIR